MKSLLNTTFKSSFPKYVYEAAKLKYELINMKKTL